MGDAARATEAHQRGAELLRAATAKFWSKEQRVFLDNLRGSPRTNPAPERPRARDVDSLRSMPRQRHRRSLQALADVPPNMGLSYPVQRRLAVLGASQTRTRRCDSPRFPHALGHDAIRIENNTLQEMWQVQTDSGSQWSHCPLSPIFVSAKTSSVSVRSPPASPTRNCVRNLPACLIWQSSATPRGPVELKSHLDGNTHRIIIKLPPNCEAELVLPSRNAVPFEPLTPARPRTNVTGFLPVAPNSKWTTIHETYHTDSHRLLAPLARMLNFKGS